MPNLCDSLQFDREGNSILPIEEVVLSATLSQLSLLQDPVLLRSESGQIRIILLDHRVLLIITIRIIITIRQPNNKVFLCVVIMPFYRVSYLSLLDLII